MNKISVVAVALLLPLLMACQGADPDSTFPKDAKDQRKERIGKLGGGEGLVLLGGDDKKKSYAAAGGMAVNPYLWRAALQSLSFLPIESADSNGGVIITDWYESPDSPGERLRINVMILDREMRSDAVKVNTFKQVKTKLNDWQNIKVDPEVDRKLEDTILTKAREIKVKSE